MGLVRSCCEQFRADLLLDFTGHENAQGQWAAAGLDTFPGLESGALLFSMDEIRSCITPSVTRVQELVAPQVAEKGEMLTVGVCHPSFPSTGRSCY